MKQLFLWIFLLSMPAWLQKCVGGEQPAERRPMASIGSEYLYEDEVLATIPRAVSAEDSARLKARFVEQWAKETLMYLSAKQNVSGNADIEKMVEAYRRSLITYEYQQQAILENVGTTITDEEIEAYYQKNTAHFLSSHNLVKGLLIKAPADSPTLSQLKKTYCNGDPEHVEELTVSCLQKGIQLDIFIDEWTSFDDVLDRVPLNLSDQKSFLKTKNHIEAEENGIQYLLYIDKHIFTGEPEPLDYVRERIRNILINDRKKEFIHEFENGIYERALEEGKIQYYE